MCVTTVHVCLPTVTMISASHQLMVKANCPLMSSQFYADRHTDIQAEAQIAMHMN